MGAFKSLVDKVQKKKEEIEREAAKKAAAKAAEMAVERGKDMAKAAVAQAGRSLRSAGAFVEEKLFAPESAERAEGVDHDARAPDPAPERARAPAPRKPGPTPAEAQARFDQEVDEELAAMKRKLAGK